MAAQDRCGVLLVNTGTPSEPTPPAMRKYLAEFLADPRIVPMNRVGWWIILHLFILPKRGRASAEKYAKIWADEGSPFIVAHEKLQAALAEALAGQGIDALVCCGMNYGEPSVLAGVCKLKEAGCSRLVVLPLYPQSAYSTTGAASDALGRALKETQWDVPYTLIDNYHDRPAYIKAIAASIENPGFRTGSDDRLLFSFHSIPLADVEAGDTYKQQVEASCQQIASEVGIERDRWTIGYQCRFDKGREWLTPFTSDVLHSWAGEGTGRIFLVCPNFAVDCLETLYEIEYELKPQYFEFVRQAGHEPADDALTYVPCLDSNPAHFEVLLDVLQPHLAGTC